MCFASQGVPIDFEPTHNCCVDETNFKVAHMAVAPERLDAVLKSVAGGMPLMKACVSFGVSRDVFYQALYRDPELGRRYADAVREQTAVRFGAGASNCVEGD